MVLTRMRSSGAGLRGARRSGRCRRAWSGWGTAAALVVTQLAGTPATAGAATGYDVSWPQCSTAQGGYDLPMPPSTASFVVIGLTQGRPFTRNPCLERQVVWARTRDVPAAAYTMAAFPTGAQVTKYGAGGPWSAATRRGRLANTGYAQGRYALKAMDAVSFDTSMVWIDVEPLPNRQPWPGGSLVARAENRIVLMGLFRAFSEARTAYGVYTNASGWKEITGNWWLPGVPAWATAGRRGRAAAEAMCRGRGVSGGRVLLAQWWSTTRDYDVACSAFDTAPPVPRPPVGASELTGDWAPDLLGRRSSDGRLVVAKGNGAGRIGARTALPGASWASMDVIDTAGDLSGDGRPDVLAREAGTGRLWLYPRSSTGWKPRVQVGTGWEGMRFVLGAGDLTRDGKTDVLAVQASNGQLWLYPGTGTAKGTFAPRVKAGTGWGGMDALVAPGDMTGDGLDDLLARHRSTGRLWLYPGDGRGGWGTRVSLGTGWGAMDHLVAPGDLDGDALPDLLAHPAGATYLWLYRGAGKGFRARVRVDSDWRGYSLLS